MAESQRAAQAAGLTAATVIARGRPEEVIVRTAADRTVDLIVVRAAEGAAGQPRLGPASVGHTARFVLDHAPCDVLLLRQGE
jgi:nucleotide-binding universal stress UspA family protein